MSKERCSCTTQWTLRRDERLDAERVREVLHGVYSKDELERRFKSLDVVKQFEVLVALELMPDELIEELIGAYN
jgi:hypothetical protein